MRIRVVVRVPRPSNRCWSAMNLCSFLLCFSVTLNFVPLDHRTLVIENRTEHELSRSSGNHTTGLIRTKRTIHRPEKWESIKNAFHRKPKSRRNTRFYLYSRRNPEKGTELCIDDRESLMHSHFDPSKRVLFLISGWLDNRFFAKWVRDAIRRLLDRGDFNVIYVAWRSIKELFVAAILIKMYSDDLAQFISFLKCAYTISGDSIHCIGHSLGAFMCGFAGDVTHIGRVTVLDAGPRPWFQRLHYTKRINRFQADFVDVIHSDFNPRFSLGLTIPLGDVDFFPNAGTIQDGCWRDKWHKGWKELKDEGLLVSADQMARYAMFCSHYRAHEWFFESVWNEQCQFVGVLCPSYQMFRNGECSCEDIWSSGHAQSTCALMGYDAEYSMMRQGLSKYTPQGKWYLKTSDFVPLTNQHCEYQYQLVIKLDTIKPCPQNGTFVVSIVAKGHELKPLKVISHEVVHSPGYGLRSHYRLTKLVLRPSPLPLTAITALFVSYQPSQHSVTGLGLRPNWSGSFVSVPWVKLSPIHVLHNRPIFFCHLDHFVQPGKTSLLRRCAST